MTTEKTEKIEAFWKNATADDVAPVMAGEMVEARFRDSETCEWKIAVLAGWSKFNERDRLPWATRGGICYKFCQVYREPSWWLKRPDPGPGWRLLGKFPDEPKLESDEFFSDLDKRWKPVATGSGPQEYGIWYRRRVEEVEPGPKHYVLRVGDTVETPSGHLIKVVSLDACQMQYELKAGYTATLPNGQTITITEKGFEVCQ